MTIILDESVRVHRFVRGLTLSIKSYVFKAVREGASFRFIVTNSKEAKLMVLEEFGEPKRLILFISFFVSHLEVEVDIEVVDPFNIVGQFMLLCQYPRVGIEPEDLMVLDEVVMVVRLIHNSRYMCQYLFILVAI